MSYRNQEEMMQERGLTVNHTRVYSWVQAYAPELVKDAELRLKPRTIYGALTKNRRAQARKLIYGVSP